MSMKKNIVISSRNFRDRFRKVKIGDYVFLVWLSYHRELNLKGQSKLNIEYNGSVQSISLTEVVDFAYDGILDKSENYKFMTENKEYFERKALKFARSYGLNV